MPINQNPAGASAIARAATLPVLLLSALAGQQSLAAQANEFRILHLEPIAISSQFTASGTNKSALSSDPRRPRHVSFTAYGRGFEIDLEPNPSLAGATAPGSTSVAFRGAITGSENSWARITQTSAATYGTVWDGSDLYVIEPAAEAVEFAASPVDLHNAQTVIYRLSDTQIQFPSGFCESLDGSTASNGAEAYTALTSELGSRVSVQAAGATKRIRVGAVGDSSFRARYQSDADANDAILVRLNNVDGIFSAQLGVEIQIPVLTLYDNDTDPFTSTTVPTNLLSELSRARQGSSTQLSLGLTHLFTGRDLDGDTVGIAYTNSICKSYGAGLTESRGRGIFIESLITAHEIGHNFGAPHDGEGACSNAPSGFLMAPKVSGNDQFSQCSLTQIRAAMQSASCITPLAPADASVPSTLGPLSAQISEPIASSIVITNLGGISATNVQAEVTIPGGLTIDSATINGQACTPVAGAVQCTAGTLTPSAVASINLNLHSGVASQYTIGVKVTSDKDSNAGNNTTSQAITVANDPPVIVAPAPSTPAAPAANTDGGGGGGGGGGSMQLPFLAALLLMALFLTAQSAAVPDRRR